MYWGELEAKECVAAFKRRYAAKLMGIPWGVSWEDSCNYNAPEITINDQKFSSPDYCENAITGEYGFWENVNDDYCKTWWGSWRKDDCDDTWGGFRLYSSVVYGAKEEISWENACANTPIDLKGFYYDRPDWCENSGLGMWGKIRIPDTSCVKCT